MPTLADDPIEICIHDALRSVSDERRRHRRYPFFRTVTILGPADTDEVAAFSRDISASGIGLLARTPFPLGRAKVRIETDLRTMHIPVEVRSSRPCGSGWYVIGAEFSALLPLNAVYLLWTTTMMGAKRRLKSRHPLFRPVELAFGTKRTRISAFSRDISQDGMGLFHGAPLETRPVTITVDTSLGPVDIAADIRWCRRCGDECYVSGAQFHRLLTSELPEMLV